MMKKLLLLILFLLITLSVSIAEVECPFGLINDTAPGQCARYIDIGANNICDLSEPHACNDTTVANPEGIELSGEEVKAMSVHELARVYGVDAVLLADALSQELTLRVAPTTSLRELHDTYGLKMARAKEIALALQTEKSVATSLPQTNTAPTTKYNLITITLITIILYFITYTLAKLGKMTMIMHRKIWNWILLLSFIATTLFALIWILNVDYRLGISLGLNTSFWHIETGIVMIIVSLFHAWWHVKYYFRMKKE